MSEKSTDRGRLELSLIPVADHTPDAPDASETEAWAAARQASEEAAQSIDIFLAKASREYAKGHIVQPLWVRALAQADGDEDAARPAYLRARATAMRVAEREKRTKRSARHARATEDVQLPEIAPKPLTRTASGRSGRSGADRRRLYIAAGAAGAVLVAIAIWWLLSPGGTTSNATSDAAVATSSSARAAARAKVQGGAAKRTVVQEDPDQAFAGKVQELRHAGNWNVLVLHASEWTRQRPENGTAWKELSIGYANMRQFDDALNAAKKAVTLLPQDPGAWRNLGQVNVALEQPAAALDAFDKAITLDDRDLLSLVQIGTLNAQLGRFPAAKAAYDRVLAASPENVDALCGQVAIAQKENRGKDAEALTRQLKSLDGKCRDATDVAAPPPARPVAVSSATKTSGPAPANAARRPVR